MNEQWSRWEPIAGLANQYYIEFVSDRIDGFQIMLCEAGDRTKKVLVTFANSVDSYRSTDESFTLKTIDDLDNKYGTNFYTQWSFFKVMNSTYLQWLSEQSYGISDSLSFHHFVFFGIDSMLDVITTYEPKVELFESK